MRPLPIFNPFIIAGLALLTASCGSKSEKIKANAVPVKPPPPAVSAHVVQIVPVGETLELAGSLLANEETDVFPEISGRLTYLNIPEGKRVQKGALLARIYDGDLRAQLHKLQTQLDVQEQTLRRYEELLKINGVSQQEYDMIRLQSNNLRADMAIVRSNIQRTEIRAPFSGTLGLKGVSPGAYVSPSTRLTTIRQTSELKLDFTIPERFAPRMQPGREVQFITEGNPKVFSAKITATESGISETDRSLRIRARVQSNNNELMPGSFVKVMVAFEADSNAIMIPSGAIIPLARGKQVAVYNNGKVRMQDIETGIRDSAMVQVLQGLKVNDTVITSGLMRLKEGDQVAIRNFR